MTDNVKTADQQDSEIADLLAEVIITTAIWLKVGEERPLTEIVREFYAFESICQMPPSLQRHIFSRAMTIYMMER